MDLNIKDAINEITRLEKVQAQLELRETQIHEEEKILNDKLKALGINPDELDTKIEELKAAISQKLTTIKNLNNPISNES